MFSPVYFLRNFFLFGRLCLGSVISDVTPPGDEKIDAGERTAPIARVALATASLSAISDR